MILWCEINFFLSRQALSKSMIKLEEEVGAQLFVRTRSGIQVTEEGRCLHEYAEQILTLWEHAAAEIESIQRSHSQTIRVAYGQMIYNLWPSNHAENFMILHPDIQVQVEILLPDSMREGLLNQSLDMAITGACYSPQLSRTLLAPRPLHALLRYDDPLASLPRLTPDDLEGKTLVFLPGNSEFTDGLIRFLKLKHISFQGQYAADSNITTILQAVLEKNAIYLTAGSFSSVITMNHIVKLPFIHEETDLLLSKDLCAVMLKKRSVSPALRQYIDYLRDTILL